MTARKESVWTPFVQTYLGEEGIVPLNAEQFFASIPAEDYERIISASGQVNAGQINDVRPGRLFFNLLAPFYDRQKGVRLSEEVLSTAYISEQLQEKKPSVVIYGGCGTGLALGFFAKAFPQISFIGYDNSARMLKIASRRLQRLGLKNTILFQADHLTASRCLLPAVADFVLFKTSFGIKSFEIPFALVDGNDIAWRNHIASDETMLLWRRTFGAVARLLKPGGQFLDVTQQMPIGVVASWRAAETDGNYLVEPKPLLLMHTEATAQLAMSDVHPAYLPGIYALHYRRL